MAFAIRLALTEMARGFRMTGLEINSGIEPFDVEMDWHEIA